MNPISGTTKVCARLYKHTQTPYARPWYFLSTKLEIRFHYITHSADTFNPYCKYGIRIKGDLLLFPIIIRTMNDINYVTFMIIKIVILFP